MMIMMMMINMQKNLFSFQNFQNQFFFGLHQANVLFTMLGPIVWTIFRIFAHFLSKFQPTSYFFVIKKTTVQKTEHSLFQPITCRSQALSHPQLSRAPIDLIAQWSMRKGLFKEGSTFLAKTVSSILFFPSKFRLFRDSFVSAIAKAQIDLIAQVSKEKTLFKKDSTFY